ncbi:uncharacterized protein LOC118159194 isoform X1 [Oxyura jamaicensis]|uniref:uncharacterized protein LOC118159194 isoform X1 n=1 Tax=Oxyura jamaicensis TaxID=8884 RepID=UPI0015A71655|nr:uncharacterized protein LOC118159194 isoform X1 [Oxyura jamaicensis]
MALSRTESLYSLSRITPGSLKMPSYLWPRQYLDVTEGRLAAVCRLCVLRVEGRELCLFKDRLRRFAVLSCAFGVLDDLLRALCSVIVRLRLQCFFLVLPEKAVVRLCEAEDSGGPLLGRLMVVGKKCTANLDLTNGFRMAVNAHPRALQTIAAE